MLGSRIPTNLRHRAPQCTKSHLSARRAAPGLRRFAPKHLSSGPPPCRTNAVASETAATADVPELKELPLLPILNQQGFVLHDQPEGTNATVLGIYDQNRNLQYIGFSKNLNHSLRTVFSRRPDKAFYFRHYDMPVLDQKAMMAVRDAWYTQSGGAPVGNTLSLERDQWTQPFVAFATSDKGKRLAAEEAVKERLAQLASRGCNEQFLPDVAQLQEGKVDFLPAAELTEEQLAQQQADMARMKAQTHICHVTIDGEESEFRVFFANIFEANGGMICDVSLVHEMRETNHRVVVGREFYDNYDLPVETIVESTFEFVLQKKMERHTEGVLSMSEFPINYFAVQEMRQLYHEFEEFLYRDLDNPPPLPEAWGFKRTVAYGPEANPRDTDGLNIAMGSTWRETEALDLWERIEEPEPEAAA